MRKTGYHVNAITESVIPTIQRARCGIIKSLDHNREVWAGTRAALQDQGIDPFLWGRLYFAHQDPRGDWKPYFEAIAPIADHLRGVYDAWEYLNEVAGNNYEDIQYFTDRSIRFAEAMHREGHKVALGSFSVGNPTDLAWWDTFFPAVLAADYIGLHEYDAPAMWSHHQVDEPRDGGMWYTLRYRRVRQWLEAGCLRLGLSPDVLPPFLIGECGIDGGVLNGQLYGWRHFCTASEYVQQLDWYEQEIQKDHYVKAAVIYCMGVWDPYWHSFDVADVAEVADWMAKGGPVAYEIGEGFRKTEHLVGPWKQNEIHHWSNTPDQTSIAVGDKGYATWRAATNETVAHCDDGRIFSDFGNRGEATGGQMVQIYPKA